MSSTTPDGERTVAREADGAASAPEPTRAELDAIIARLGERAREWVGLGAAERLALLDRIMADVMAVADEWVMACAAAKGLEPDSDRVGEEWGILTALVRQLRLMRDALDQASRSGVPAIPGEVTRRADGGLMLEVFPISAYDRMFFSGVTAQVWLEPGLGPDELEKEHREAFRPPGRGQVALVLGAGNISTLGPMDLLHKLFVDHQVVVYKSNPVLAYLDPILRRAFGVLVERGYLELVSGGAEVGDYVACHPGVHALHLTGSDRTYEAIVYGTGEEGARRKRERDPRVDKPFSCELGNISPLIVVPGPWSDADVAYQGEHIASTLTLNAGFNCLSTRVIVQHGSWPLRQRLVDAVVAALGKAPPRKAYYPGAGRIHARFLEAHPDAIRVGEGKEGSLPWTLVANVDPGNADDPCFTQEPFCSLFSETALSANDVPSYVDAAVRFCNETLWGTLTASILVHPASLKEPAVREAVERAVADLRYGTVAVNLWGIMGFLFGTTTWGAFPGHPPHDIQSGTGVVNNALRLPRVHKSVLRGPFRVFPKPPVFLSHRTLLDLYRRFTRFESDPGPLGVPGIMWSAMRG